MFAEFEYPVSQNMFGTVWLFFVIVDNSLRKERTLSWLDYAITVK